MTTLTEIYSVYYTELGINHRLGTFEYIGDIKYGMELNSYNSLTPAEVKKICIALKEGKDIKCEMVDSFYED